MALVAQTERPRVDYTELVRKAVLDVCAAERSQKRLLPSYRVLKRYTVKHDKLRTPAVLDVLWTYQPQTGKRFEIKGGQNVSGFTRRALIEVLENESKNSLLEEDPGSITPDHYSFDFELAKPDQLKLRITPLKKSKYLLNGNVFIRTESAAIVRVEGTTSKRLSFWVSEAKIEQEFGEFRKFWLPTKTRSRARVRFVGQTELTIEAGEYEFHTGASVN